MTGDHKRYRMKVSGHATSSERNLSVSFNEYSISTIDTMHCLIVLIVSISEVEKLQACCTNTKMIGIATIADNDPITNLSY